MISMELKTSREKIKKLHTTEKCTAMRYSCVATLTGWFERYLNFKVQIITEVISSLYLPIVTVLSVIFGERKISTVE